MIIGVLKEPTFESRVSLLPLETSVLVKKGISIWVETGAGLKSFCSDEEYTKSGAVIKSHDEILTSAELILSINLDDIPSSLQNKLLIGVYQPMLNNKIMNDWAKRNITSFSLDMLPRTSRAQSMDVLSSQNNIAGYKSVILAASMYSRAFPMFTTAAGTIRPASVLILGAGVAGLQAVATAKRLGAVVEVFDTRPAVKEEVMSLGARFVEVDGATYDAKAGGYAVEQTEDFKKRQKDRIAESIKKADVVITTAQIFGKKAPILVTKEMMDNMKPGSILVDLAASTGGNTEVTKDNETVIYGGVTVIGNSNLMATLPSDASKLYGKNIINFLNIFILNEGSLKPDFHNCIVEGACITCGGEITNPRIKVLVNN
jgi:H+-translocating NAD(P) transhydrogenase subunit alpha